MFPIEEFLIMVLAQDATVSWAGHSPHPTSTLDSSLEAKSSLPQEFPSSLKGCVGYLNAEHVQFPEYRLPLPTCRLAIKERWKGKADIKYLNGHGAPYGILGSFCSLPEYGSWFSSNTLSVQAVKMDGDNYYTQE